MSTGEPRGISLEELKDLARPAARVPELVAIARTALSNTEAKDRALEFTKEQGLDEAIAKSCRWLKILRDRLIKEGREEEFNRFVRKAQKEERDVEKKTIEEEKIFEVVLPQEAWEIVRDRLPHLGTNVLGRETLRVYGIDGFLEMLLRGLSLVEGEDWNLDAEKNRGYGPGSDLRRKMLRILEGKFGIPVRTCYHCKRFVLGARPPGYDYDKAIEGECFETSNSRPKCIYDGLHPLCKAARWAPKEVSQKVEADSPR